MIPARAGVFGDRMCFDADDLAAGNLIAGAETGCGLETFDV